MKNFVLKIGNEENLDGPSTGSFVALKTYLQGCLGWSSPEIVSLIISTGCYNHIQKPGASQLISINPALWPNTSGEIWRDLSNETNNSLYTTVTFSPSPGGAHGYNLCRQLLVDKRISSTYWKVAELVSHRLLIACPAADLLLSAQSLPAYLGFQIVVNLQTLGRDDREGTWAGQKVSLAVRLYFTET